MGIITTTAQQVFRDYNTDGVPGSGAHHPSKSEIRTLFGLVDTTGADQILDMKAFGATGDGVTNDYSAIVDAIGYCVANNLTLGITDGTYCHGSTIQWAHPRFRVIALGDNVIFKHTGTGVAHSFNGLATGTPTEGVFANVFGGPHRIRLHGNPAGGTTKLVNINNWHWSEMKISGRDAQYIVYGENSGAGQGACMKSTFDIDIRQGNDGVVFAIKPDIGIRMDMCYASLFIRPTVEQCGTGGQPAVQLTNSNGNTFLAGTFESNLATGLYIGTGCERNTFIGLHNEANDLDANGSADYNILGKDNTFIGCAGAATTGGQVISGDRNVFQGCLLQSVVVQATADGTCFDNCQLIVAFTDNGTHTRVINPSDTGIIGAFDNSATSLRNKTINTASGNSVLVDSIDVSTAWTSYTPTLTAQTGAITTSSATGRYKRIGKTVFAEMDVILTAPGTGSGYLNVSLPVTAAAFRYSGSVFEYNQATNVAGGGVIGPSGTTFQTKTAAGGGWWTAGNRLAITIVYEAA